ncbi:MAG: UDP-N-acetylmuramoylalanyl-D-glutamyl-2,6-diaminopimelate--D-alanyl-D-alanine ligase [Rhizobiales bacterium]|nr:UDP-N-acetylmuramoylalanyl-D-glutamyl-2,6-diaminopimelate--D-alanyl-D-alanine ligase [Hyphomicrobiales bacterium]
MSARPLWTVDAMAAAMAARQSGAVPASITGISIDTRTIAPGEAFFAITGENRDGHDFVAAALQAGAGLAVVSAARFGDTPASAPLLVVDDVLDGLRDLAKAARARSQARIVAVTGSVGKTGTKDALRLVLERQGETHASAASYNNHWGVPLSLARCPETAEFAVLEMGMNHAGEIEPLSRLVRPHVAIVTAVEPVHLEFFDSVDAIADAKAEIFSGVAPRGAAVINRDNAHFERLRCAAQASGIAHIVSFGEHAEADARLDKIALHADCSTVAASILGVEVTYKVGAPGRHIVQNSLAVLAATSLLGADLALAALALADLQPPAGRGARQTLTVPGGTALLIDESYNANPASMRAALALLGHVPMGPRGRRIAVLGDMLELGPRGRDLHHALVEPVLAHGIELVFCSGPLMRALWEALPPERRGGYAETAAAIEPAVVAEIHAGDAVMVKGSLGSKMGPIVTALARKYSSQWPATATAQG